MSQDQIAKLDLTDRELVLELCRRIGLSEVAASDVLPPSDKEYAVSQDGFIHLGAGAGYNGFFVGFKFGPDGKIIEYGVWE